MGIVVDEDFPFILQGFPVGPKGEAALHELFDRMSAIAARAIPVVAAATPDEMIDLAEARLEEAGVRVPSEVVLRVPLAARKLHVTIRGRATSG